MQQGLAVMGLIAAIVFGIFDICTSYTGIHTFIPEDNQYMILSMVPLIGALTVSAFNGLSSQILIEAKNEEYAKLSKQFIVGLWLFCLLFDCISSFIGFLTMLSTVEIHGWQSFKLAIGSMDAGRWVFCLVISILVTCSPLLVVLFWNLSRGAREQFGQSFDLGE